MATPFVQGRLLGRRLTATVQTSCAHCGKPMTFDLDSEMVFMNRSPGSEPVVFMPDVNWEEHKEPSIIDAF
jgi:hypothetical protein